MRANPLYRLARALVEREEINVNEVLMTAGDCVLDTLPYGYSIVMIAVGPPNDEGNEIAMVHRGFVPKDALPLLMMHLSAQCEGECMEAGACEDINCEGAHKH